MLQVVDMQYLCPAVTLLLMIVRLEEAPTWMNIMMVGELKLMELEDIPSVITQLDIIQIMA